MVLTAKHYSQFRKSIATAWWLYRDLLPEASHAMSIGSDGNEIPCKHTSSLSSAS